MLIANLLRKYQYDFHPVVAFDASRHRLLLLDFTEANPRLTADILEDTEAFSRYITEELQAAAARFGIGGYGENRTVYQRSRVFDAQAPGDSPRRVHLGTDIWGPAGTPVYAFMGGMIHSFAYNNRFGDYGATLILTHQLDGEPFYSLYGHLALRDIQGIAPGEYISRGEQIGHFGEPAENGHWPPHLHFQLIRDLELKEGDYPGVCRFTDKEYYLENCPDPDLVLRLNRYLDAEKPASLD